MKKKVSSKRHAYSVRLAAEARLPTKYGSFRIVGFENKRKEWIVGLLRGNISRARAPLVRIHSQCLTGDVFCSLRCDCRAQLEMALKAIAKERAGIVLAAVDAVAVTGNGPNARRRPKRQAES